MSVKRDLSRLKRKGYTRDRMPIPRIEEEEKQKHIHPRRKRHEQKNV